MRISRAAVVVFLAGGLVAGGYIFGRSPRFEVSLQMASTEASEAQLYFDVGHDINEDDSARLRVEGRGLAQFEGLSFPFSARRLYGFRFDPLTRDGTFAIRNMAIRGYGRLLLRLNAEQLKPNEQIGRQQKDTGGAMVYATLPNATDPQLSFHLRKPLRLDRELFGANVLLYLCLLPVLFLLVTGVDLGIRQFEAIPRLMRANGLKLSVAMLCLLPWAGLAPAFWNSLSQDPLVYMGGITVKSQPSLLPGHIWLDPNVGFTTQALGGLSASDWLHGTVPWWNPYTGVGLPLAAEMQPSSLFLPFVLLLHFPNGVLYLKLVLEVFAGLSTYFLLRALDLGSLAALCGGILFELCGTFAWMSDAPIMPIAFLPLLMLGIELARKAERRAGGCWGMILISLSIGWSLLAGFPETAFLDGVLALAWIGVRSPELPKAHRAKFFFRVAAAGFGGLLLATPVLVPFVEYQSLSAIKHVSSLDGSPPAALATFLLPYVFGPIGEFSKFDPSGTVGQIWGGIGGYLGCAGAFLAVTGVFGRTRLGARSLLTAWITVFLARCIGVRWVGMLLNFVPGLRLAIIPRYSAPSWEFAAVILAAFALDDWRRAQNRRARKMLACSLVFLALCGCALLTSRGLIEALLRNTLQYRDWLRFSLLSAVLVVLVLGYLLSRAKSFHAALAAGFVVASYALVACSVPTLSGVRNPVIDTAAIRFLRNGLGLQRFYTLGSISPNYGAFFQIASINHNAIPISADWVNWVQANLDSGLNAPIFVGNQPAPGEERILQLKEHLAKFGEAAVKYVVAPAWTHGCESSPAENESKLQIPELKCVYRDGLLAILELPHFSTYYQVKGGECTVLNESRLRIETQCAGNAILLRRELFYPGWRATINDSKTPVKRAGEIFQSIDLPPGRTKIVFSYTPSHLFWIEVGFWAGITWLGALFIFGRANPGDGAAPSRFVQFFGI